MRLRIRTLLLTVALLCSMSSTSRAGIYIPIFDPFYWLFGGCGYGAGGVSGGGYGYVNNGNSNGYGPNPYGFSRCVDDWLGYGYLRNQEGTLGHYPGRPVSCYNPAFPCLLNPATWFPPCPLFAPYTTFGPSCGVTAPMVAPLAPPMPYQQPMPFQHMPYQGQCQNAAPWQMPMPQMPMPPMVNPYGGMYGNACGPQCMPQQQCMPQPMMQCQPMRVPVTTMHPVTVDRGYWQRVWVSRPVTTMVPQTHYVTTAPPMQMPYMQNQFMGSPMMDSGCGCDAGGDCDCGGSMGEMMPGADMMQGSGFPEMHSEPGCCGSEGGMMQPNFESGAPVVPQSTMMMSPGSMTMSRMSMPMTPMQMSRMSMGQSSSIAPYSSLSRWYSNPGYSTQFSNPAYTRSMAMRSGYGTAMYGHPQPRNYTNSMAMMPTPMMSTRRSSGWQVVPSQHAPMQMAQTQQMAQIPQMRPMPIQMRNTSPMTAQMMPQQFSPMQSQRPMSPMVSNTMAGNNFPRPMTHGDIHGDHELTGPISAAVPVVPNSYNGRGQIQQASWTQPARTSTAQKYPNSVQ